MEAPIMVCCSTQNCLINAFIISRALSWPVNQQQRPRLSRNHLAGSILPREPAQFQNLIKNFLKNLSLSLSPDPPPPTRCSQIQRFLFFRVCCRTKQRHPNFFPSVVAADQKVPEKLLTAEGRSPPCSFQGFPVRPELCCFVFRCFRRPHRFLTC